MWVVKIFILKSFSFPFTLSSQQSCFSNIEVWVVTLTDENALNLEIVNREKGYLLPT